MCFWNYIVVFPFFAERYLAEMQEMNKAIKNASNIRPLLRELDGLREELSILMTMTTPETSRHPNDTRQIQKLLERAKEVKSTIRRDFQIALTVKKELGQVTGFQQKKILKRRQMLENEMKEATPFVDRAKTVYTDIRQVCGRAAISDYRTQPVSEERLTIRPCHGRVVSITTKCTVWQGRTARLLRRCSQIMVVSCIQSACHVSQSCRHYVTRPRE